MFEAQFIFQNLHFTINIIAAFIFFCVGWLYFDAWLFKKNPRDFLKLAGFALISLSFLIHATVIEQVILQTPFLGQNVIQFAGIILEIAGLILLVISLLLEGVQKVVHSPDIKKSYPHNFFIFSPAVSLIVWPWLLAPFLAAFAGFLYLRRATVGLENHLKPVSLAFFLLAFSHVSSLRSLFQESSNPAVYNLVSSFGLFWILDHIFLVLAIIVIGRWVFQYLLTRVQTQIFIISEIFILIIFLMITMTFSTFLLRNMREDQLAHLKTDVNVLTYAVENKKAETLSDAQLISQNTQIIQAVQDKDRHTLRNVTESILLSKKQAFLTVVSEDAVVLMRAEDPENVSDSLSGDVLVKRALTGENISTVTVRDGVMAPVVSIRSAVPIGEKDNIIGAVIIGVNIDNAFVDGVKRATGLDAAVYGDNIRASTTFVASDGKSRWIGIKEDREPVKKTVLEEGNTYIGGMDIQNIPYLSAFAPLKDIDNNPVGMLFVAKEQAGVLQAAAFSIQLTFIFSAFLLILSLAITYFFAKYLTAQFK